MNSTPGPATSAGARPRRKFQGISDLLRNFASEPPARNEVSASEFHKLRVAAFLIAAILLFAVLTAFSHALWPVAISCTVLFSAALWTLRLWIVGRFRVTFGITDILLLMLPLIGAAQYAFDITVYPFGTLLAVVSLSGAACCFWLCRQMFRSPVIARQFRFFLVVFGMATSVIALVQLLTSEGRILWVFTTVEVPHPMATFLNRDRYCAFIELLLPLAVYEALNYGERWALYGVGAAAMYASVVASGSRAGLIAATVELLVVAAVVMRSGRMRSRAWTTPVLILVTAILSTAIGWHSVLERFRESDPFRYRREFLISSIRMWRERPWLGFGLGSWPSVYPRFAIIDPGRYVNHAHNEWAEWAGEGGILLVIAWAAVALRAARFALRRPEALGVTIVFLHSFVDFNFRTWAILLLVPVLIALAERAPLEEA